MPKQPVGKRQQPSDVGPKLSHGEKTRQRIVKAATKVFAERGFAGASTREIARRAHIKAPALRYHFSGKSGLHVACAEYFVEHAWTYLREPASRAEGILAGDATNEELLDALCSMFAAQVDLWLHPEEDDAWRRFYHQEQMQASQPAYMVVVSQHTLPVNSIIYRLLSKLTGRAIDDQNLRTNALMLSGEVMPFSMIPPQMLLAITGWDSISDSRRQYIKDLIRDRVVATVELLRKGTRKPKPSRP